MADPVAVPEADSVVGSVVGSVEGSVEGSVAVPVAVPVADSVIDSVADPVAVPVADSVVDSVADSVACSDDCRLVGCTITLEIEPVEATSSVEAVTSDTMLLRMEVRGRPVGVSSVALALVDAVSIELALGVTSEERAVVVSVTDDAEGDETVVSAELGPVAEDGAVKVVPLSAEVTVGASSADVAVGASSSVALVLAGGGSLGETTAVLNVAVLALSVSDWASVAVVIKTGPDGPRLVRMSDNERLRLDDESDVVVSAVEEGSVVVISVTVALVNCLLTSRGK